MFVYLGEYTTEELPRNVLNKKDMSLITLSFSNTAPEDRTNIYRGLLESQILLSNIIQTEN